MPMIEWSSTLSVNVKEVDDQHKKLFNLINKLNDAMLQRRAKEEMGHVISELLQYTVIHFSLEEGYFDKFGYPDAPAHKAEHVHFIAEVKKFKNDFESGKLGLSIEIMTFLNDWLKKHIMGVDKKYTAFFNEKGLK
ncbi:TPA: hemerythrin [Candidatus Sumerlaeota bacterium]|nr:hemerythrin [Candidatus Sumerlaeota bacterium]